MGARATLLPKVQGKAEIRCVSKLSGSGERELGVVERIRIHPAVGASGTAGLGASAQRLVDDGLDGARTAATFGAAAEAAIDLLGITRKVFRGIYSTTDIVVAKDVTGTNNHESERAHR